MADVEHPLTENQMAAIAAGLWEPGQQCDEFGSSGCRQRTKYGDERAWSWDDVDCTYYHRPRHEIPAPDMHLPENLWRALENVPRSVLLGILYRMTDPSATKPLKELVLDALVAVYKAEHPE